MKILKNIFIKKKINKQNNLFFDFIIILFNEIGAFPKALGDSELPEILQPQNPPLET